MSHVQAYIIYTHTAGETIVLIFNSTFVWYSSFRGASPLVRGRVKGHTLVWGHLSMVPLTNTLH